MHAVRKHILEILKENGSATVAELASSLEMVPVSVRHHLDILQGDNLIGVDRVRRQGSVGRPQQVYTLTDQAEEHFPDNFAVLASGLVRQLKAHLPPEQVEASFCSLAREIAGELPPVDLAALPMPERMQRVTAFLSDKGYLAGWEKVPAAEVTTQASPQSGAQSTIPWTAALLDPSEEVYLLHTCNCPYAKVSSEHGELCLMDQVLVRTLLGDGCQRVESLANGGSRCTYMVPDRVPERVPDKVLVSAPGQ